MEQQCVRNSDCGSREWCEEGLCTCFGWTGSTGPPECRGVSHISLLVSAVAVVCAFTSVMFLLLHILVLIQKALFSRRVVLWANQRAQNNDQDALRGGSHEANGPDGARRSSLRQWIVGLCRRGGRLLTHKTIFHVCSIIACVTRAVIEIMRCVMPLGYLDVRQLTYSPLAPLNYLECVYMCATLLWAVVLAVIWVDTAVAAGLREPRMWCGSSTFTIISVCGVCLWIALCGAVYTMAYWVASVWAIFMGFSVSRAYAVGLQSLFADQPIPPPTLRQKLAARVQQLLCGTDREGLGGDEEDGNALALSSYSRSKPSAVAPLSPPSSDNPLVQGQHRSHSGQHSGGSPNNSVAGPQLPAHPEDLSPPPQASRKKSSSTASDGGEREKEGVHSSEQRRQLVLKDVVRLAHKIVAYFSLGGCCHVLFGFLYSSKLTAHYALIFWMVGNLFFLVANLAALHFLSRWLRFIMFRCCGVKQRNFAQEQVQARMMRIEPEQKRTPRQE